MSAVNERVKGRFDEVVVYSVDHQANTGLIDCLPDSATKRTALEYVAEKHGTPREEVVYCGDSGNDILPLTAGFSGVLVRNADDQLIRNVKEATRRDPRLKVYFAKGGVQRVEWVLHERSDRGGRPLRHSLRIRVIGSVRRRNGGRGQNCCSSPRIDVSETYPVRKKAIARLRQSGSPTSTTVSPTR